MTGPKGLVPNSAEPSPAVGLLPWGARLVGGLGFAEERGLGVGLELYSHLPTASLQA